MMTSWVYLIFAILFEVSGTMCMKMSQGFTKLVPSVFLFVFYACSFTLMTLALRKLEVSFVYAIWSGIGTALVALIGIYFFKEQVTPIKILSMGLIIAGVIGLNVGTAGNP